MSHPYISGPGNVAKMISSLRNAFPAVVSAETVKKLGIAPNNESYIINALQFVNVLDTEGKKTQEAVTAFASHKDEDFEKNFKPLIKKAYSDLFELHSDGAWKLNRDDLITFFRQSDDTSAVIGGRQAGLFQVFAALSGHGEIPTPKASAVRGKKEKTASLKPIIKNSSSSKPENTKNNKLENNPQNNGSFSMSVKLEINIPSDGSKETYDNIFRSIREHLMND